MDNQSEKIEENISDKERIISTKRPDGVTVFVHQFKEGNNWKMCLKCGEGLPTPSTRPGPVLKIEHIRKYCPLYKSTIKSK